jgi:hypothetical protein
VGSQWPCSSTTVAARRPLTVILHRRWPFWPRARRDCAPGRMRIASSLEEDPVRGLLDWRSVPASSSLATTGSTLTMTLAPSGGATGYAVYAPAYPATRPASVIHIRNIYTCICKEKKTYLVQWITITLSRDTATREAHMTRPTAHTASPGVQYGNTCTTTFSFQIFLIQNPKSRSESEPQREITADRTRRLTL